LFFPHLGRFLKDLRRSRLTGLNAADKINKLIPARIFPPKDGVFMAKKPTPKKSSRRVSRVKREPLPTLDAPSTQTECCSSSCHHTLWIWALAIVVVLGLVFKSKLSCGFGQNPIKVKALGMVATETLEGGPYSASYLCGLGKGLYAVSDEGRAKILVMDLGGKLQNVFGAKGTKRSQLQHNVGMTTDKEGNVFVLDHELADVFGFKQDGTKFLQVDSRATGFFYGPRGVAYLNGNFAIADTGSCRIVVMDPAGQTVAKWGDRGSKPDQLVSPNAIVVNADGNLVVSDQDNKRLKVYDPKGKVLKVKNLDRKPASIATDAKNRLFVSYGDEAFVDVFDAKSLRSLGKLVVENPDQEPEYRKITALSVLDGDKLIAGGNTRIWVYQL
jgi:catechol 2,3-dioxygenase-like lactoylglutathione lyase family enzyme